MHGARVDHEENQHFSIQFRQPLGRDRRPGHTPASGTSAQDGAAAAAAFAGTHDLHRFPVAPAGRRVAADPDPHPAAHGHRRPRYACERMPRHRTNDPIRPRAPTAAVAATRHSGDPRAEPILAPKRVPDATRRTPATTATPRSVRRDAPPPEEIVATNWAESCPRAPESVLLPAMPDTLADELTAIGPELDDEGRRWVRWACLHRSYVYESIPGQSRLRRNP